MRSLSFTRSSPAPDTSRCPAERRARGEDRQLVDQAGHFLRLDVVDRWFPWSTRMRAHGLAGDLVPPPRLSHRAPMRSSARMKPSRWGFRHTPVSSTDDPGSAAAAAAQTAAVDGIAGHRRASGRRDGLLDPPYRNGYRTCPKLERTGRRGRSSPTEGQRPGTRARVWSRVARGSTTVVVPRAARPASMMALLTCALATRLCHVIAVQLPP